MTQDFAPGTEIELPPGPGELTLRLFPREPVPTAAFLDRQEEFQRLIDMALGSHSGWFDCPPGYGVHTLTTRLCKRFAHHYKPRFCTTHASLLQVHDVPSFTEPLLEACGQLASQALRRTNITDEKIVRVFDGFEKYIYYDLKNLQTIGFRIHSAHLEAVIAIGTELQGMLEEHRCRGIVALSGLQQLAVIKEWPELLASLAQLVRLTPAISWLFSGHNQYCMRTMFAAEPSPMPQVCKRFRLRAIDTGVYLDYLAESAQARWGCFIGKKATQMILALPRRNPYWLNGLCRILWNRDVAPLIPNVISAWNELVYSHRYGFIREIERLSTNQRAVLICLARQPTAQPRSKAFVHATRVSSASVGQAVTILQRRDLIECTVDGVWRIKNPAMQWLLARPQQLIDDVYAGRDVSSQVV